MTRTRLPQTQTLYFYVVFVLGSQVVSKIANPTATGEPPRQHQNQIWSNFADAKPPQQHPNQIWSDFANAGLAKNCQICAGLSDIGSQAWASRDLSLSLIEFELGLHRIGFGGLGCVSFWRWSGVGVRIVVGRRAGQQFQIWPFFAATLFGANLAVAVSGWGLTSGGFKTDWVLWKENIGCVLCLIYFVFEWCVNSLLNAVKHHFYSSFL